MKIKILTLFPEVFDYLENYGVLGRALREEKLTVETVQIRDYAKNKHQSVDDTIYGGGSGMLMTCQPIVDSLRDHQTGKTKVYYLSPQAPVLTQEKLKEMAEEEEIILLCGHYEGIDSRIVHHYIDEEISIGDYVLTGGEMAAMVLVDGISRMIPGVLGNKESASGDSHYNLLLQEDQYTKPREFEGHLVPDILLSGNHKKIQKWREKSALENTKNKRPDLYEKYKSVRE